ncbi:MAG: response regulator transcription factor [Spirochaetales bacterium]|jgi:DNA-binding NarL/FixJ family response regulator|nr:response regulator transcription factor [Spirochaetales bacterium]
MEECRIVIADDHDLVRRGLHAVLGEDPTLHIVSEVADGLTLLKTIAAVPVDLVVLNMFMPGLGGIEAIPEILRLQPEVKIVVLTTHKNEQYLCTALAAGVRGYLLKEDPDKWILPSLHRVIEGELVISPSFSELFLDDLDEACRKRLAANKHHLSPRERQILQFVCEGHTNKVTGEKLHISKRTVEHHRASLMKKLDVKKTADLVTYAINEGYISR